LAESNFLRAALTYAARGWAVFPCWPKTKKPYIHAWEQRATTDEATIRQWWKEQPRANVAIHAGLSKLVVIDVDAGGDAAINEYSSIHKLPPTVMAATPSGGAHLLFAYEGEDLSIGQGLFGADSGVDWRAGNGYIMAAPSIHPDYPDGPAYKWDKDAHPARTELAALPAALLDRLRDGAPTNRPTQPNLEPEIIESGQDAYGARQAAVLARKGFAKEEARAALGAMIETRFAGGWTGLDARRPWKAQDVERWLKGAYEKFYDPEAGDSQTEAAEAIAALMGPGRALAGAAAPNAITQRNTQKPPPATVAGISAAELQGRDFSPIKWVISDLLPEGASILGGKPKVGKSWLVLGLASAVASRDDYAFGEMPVSRGDVLYLALEDGQRRLKRRMAKILGNRPWPKDLTFFTEWPRVNEGGVEAIDKWLDEHPNTQLVVIDTLKHIEPSELTKGQGGYRADYQSITPLQNLAQRRGVAILIVTHLRKLGSDDPIDMLQGTLGLSGGIDNFYVFTRPKNSLKGTLYYRGRDVDEGELALIWREGDSMLWRLDDDSPAKPGDAVLEAIRPGETVSPQALADRLNLPADTVGKRLERLAESGQVVRLKRGSYGLPAQAMTDF
jgi:hypothetical protein